MIFIEKNTIRTSYKQWFEEKIVNACQAQSQLSATIDCNRRLFNRIWQLPQKAIGLGLSMVVRLLGHQLKLLGRSTSPLWYLETYLHVSFWHGETRDGNMP